MMKMSKRARRMERHHRQRKRPGVNLISLMDIFTILVFFLLVSSSNVQQIPSQKDIRLPTTITDTLPQETLIIYVTRADILVQGRKVAEIDSATAQPDLLIQGLVDELQFQASQTTLFADDAAPTVGKAITIMGDELIPYKLLRKILASCREANYTRIAFAALQQSRSGSSAP